MEYIKKRLRFILIFIFSLAILLLVQWITSTDKNLDTNKNYLLIQILKIACGGYGLYALVQFFRVK